MNIQSDDDFDMASPRNSRTRKSQILNSRSIDPDATAVSNAATPLTSTQGTSSFGAFPTSAPPTTTSTKPTPSSSGHRKGGLRVGKETAMLSQEWIEWALVMVIVNLCLLGIIRTTAVLDRVVYVGVLNLVVAHSLYLRAHRCTSSVASALAAAASTAASVVATTSTELTTAATAVVPGLNTLTSLTSAATTATGTATDAVSAGRSLMSQGKKPVAGIYLAFVFIPSSIYGFYSLFLYLFMGLLFCPFSLYGFYYSPLLSIDQLINDPILLTTTLLHFTALRRLHAGAGVHRAQAVP